MKTLHGIILSLCILPTSCDQETTDPEDPIECSVPGLHRPCECTNGWEGTQICLNWKKWSDCVWCYEPNIASPSNDTDTNTETENPSNANTDSYDTSSHIDNSEGNCNVGYSESCPGIACWDIVDQNPEAKNGAYWILGEEEKPFQVYCDTETWVNGRRGYTLVDNDATAEEEFTERLPGANPDISVTRGSYLPFYAWSDQPEIMCKFGTKTDNQWRTFLAKDDNEHFLEYPIKTTFERPSTDAWYHGVTNGLPQEGSRDVRTTTLTDGHLFLSSGPAAFCVCNTKLSPSSPRRGSSAGLESESSTNSTCSTWVR